MYNLFVNLKIFNFKSSDKNFYTKVIVRNNQFLVLKQTILYIILNWPVLCMNYFKIINEKHS